tara:strand:+ start:534 stop:890 length:357 start_codon:yes stop_codon:yes gene_type:complete
MFQMLAGSGGKVVGVKASGRLTDADYQEFLPQLEKIIDQYGPLHMLVDLADFEGFSPKAAWDDFAFGMTHWHDFARIALVGDRAWEEMAARLANLLMRGEVRFFPLAEMDAAWEWVKG